MLYAKSNYHYLHCLTCMIHILIGGHCVGISYTSFTTFLHLYMRNVGVHPSLLYSKSDLFLTECESIIDLRYLQVSLGTLLAFTMVAISVLVLRYVPPMEVPFPPSFQKAIDSVSLQHVFSYYPESVIVENAKVCSINPEMAPLLASKESPIPYLLSVKPESMCSCKLIFFVISTILVCKYIVLTSIYSSNKVSTMIAISTWFL